MGKRIDARRGFERLKPEIPQHPPFGGIECADGYIAQGYAPRPDGAARRVMSPAAGRKAGERAPADRRRAPNPIPAERACPFGLLALHLVHTMYN